MKIKSRLRFEIKEITAEGTFEGLLSPYGNIDDGADVVEPGAYTKTLKERGNKVPLLWQHKADMPIGELELDDRKDGLWAKGKLLLELPEAQKAYVLIKNRVVKGMSIGYESVKDVVEKGVRYLKEIKLYEGSLVTFPMNERALISGVKANGETKGDFNEELSEYQTLDAYYQMMEALRTAMSSLVWSDMERDEKVAMCQTILQQFSDAFAEFFPTYLDTLAEVYGIKENDSWSKKHTEVKAGAEFSAANVEKIKGVCEKLLDAHSSLSALVETKAGPSTLTTPAAETKSEPDEDHSADAAIADAFTEMLAKANAALSSK
jgi:HK97 family phage prohead protease